MPCEKAAKEVKVKIHKQLKNHKKCLKTQLKMSLIFEQYVHNNYYSYNYNYKGCHRTNTHGRNAAGFR